MVNQKNKQTFSPPRVGEVSNLAGAECTINSKVYHKKGKVSLLGSSFQEALLARQQYLAPIE